MNNKLDTKQLIDLCLAEAKKSTAKKRKVGCVIVDKENNVIGTGYNHNPNTPGRCEDDEGNTLQDVVHAEMMAIMDAKEKVTDNSTIYITHPPCIKCKAAIFFHGIEHIVVIDQFLKYDTNKLRYDLIPPEVLEALAGVLTYGAKKYKPDNWKQCEDTSRFVASLMRHFEAYRKGQLYDADSGFLHLANVMANAMFLLYFNIKNERKYYERKNKSKTK